MTWHYCNFRGPGRTSIDHGEFDPPVMLVASHVTQTSRIAQLPTDRELACCGSSLVAGLSVASSTPSRLKYAVGPCFCTCLRGEPSGTVGKHCPGSRDSCSCYGLPSPVRSWCGLCGLSGNGKGTSVVLRFAECCIGTGAKCGGRIVRCRRPRAII